MTNKKVIIIGAGCAGLSAAYTLKKAGVDFLLLESTLHVGGRCRTEIDDGYEFISGAGSTEPQWETTFSYLDELGIRDKVFSIKKQRYGFVRNGKLRTVFFGGNFWETLKTLPENIRFLCAGMPWKVFPQVVKTMCCLIKYIKKIDEKAHNFKALNEISAMSTADFVLKYGGKAALEWVFHPFLATMVLAKPADISIAHPISLFALMKGMCSMNGGLGQITAGLYEKVKENVCLNTRVTRIVLQNGRAVGVETKDGFIEASDVICAVDAVDALQILPDLPESMRAPLETCRYSSTYYYQFALEKSIIKHTDTPFFVVMIPENADSLLDFVSLNSNSAEKPVVIAPTRGWEDEKFKHLTNDERRRLVITEIQKLYPDFPSEPKHTKVFRWNRAVNTESPEQVLAMQDFKKNHCTDVTGLHLAGEYLFLIACTEGAFSTGKEAAQAIIGA